MNNEQRLFEDYANGNIDLYEIQCKLNIHCNNEEREQAAKQKRLLNKLSQNYGCARGPEDILIEKEKIQTIISVMQKLKQNMPDDWWNILINVAVYKKTQREIAESLGISHQMVSRKIKKAILLASEIITISEYKACFARTSMLEADTPKIKIKYPADYFSSTPCKMHEYLDDNKTVCCNYCGKTCTNKIMKGRV